MCAGNWIEEGVEVGWEDERRMVKERKMELEDGKAKDVKAYPRGDNRNRNGMGNDELRHVVPVGHHTEFAAPLKGTQA